jgi:hypothetical protein
MLFSDGLYGENTLHFNVPNVKKIIENTAGYVHNEVCSMKGYFAENDGNFLALPVNAYL